jgi:magnesium-transporting ATPase (P-type)
MNDIEENKKRNLSFIIIAVIVIFIVLVFVFSLGTYKFKDKQEIYIYEGIDFGKVSKSIEDEISKRDLRLSEITTEKARIIKKTNRTINGLKLSIFSLWIVFNLVVYYCNSTKYGVYEFKLWNEALIISLAFILFMISEKFTSLQIAFENLKNVILKRVLAKHNLFLSEEKRISEELYYLEAIYYTHPGVLAKPNSKYT